MKKSYIIKGLLALFLFTSTCVFAAESNVDTLVKNKDIDAITKLIKTTQIIEDESLIPDNPKDNDLVIIENEYDVKVLFEFLNGSWNEKTGKFIADVLNDQKSTYMHLFNYKVSGKEFNKYISDKDSVKVYDDGSEKKVVVKIIASKFNDTAINSTLKVYSQTHLVGANDVINIQIVNIRNEGAETNCDIIYSYKE